MNGLDICRKAQEVFGKPWRDELCKICSVSLKTVYRWENQETEPLPIYSEICEKFFFAFDNQKKLS